MGTVLYLTVLWLLYSIIFWFRVRGVRVNWDRQDGGILIQYQKNETRAGLSRGSAHSQAEVTRSAKRAITRERNAVPHMKTLSTISTFSASNICDLRGGDKTRDKTTASLNWADEGDRQHYKCKTKNYYQ